MAGFTTFNPLDKASFITLSGGNLTATNTTSGSNFEGVRAVDFQSTGTFYAEFIINAISGSLSSNGSLVIGVANATQAIVTATFGASANGYGYYPWSGLSFINGVAGTIQSDQNVGHVIGMAVNVALKKVWTRAQNGNWNNAAIGSQNPVGNVGGIDVSAITGNIVPTVFCQQGGGCTANFGATAFANTAPTGYVGWPGAAGAASLERMMLGMF